jgi:hypothetical protein
MKSRMVRQWERVRTDEVKNGKAVEERTDEVKNKLDHRNGRLSCG